MMVKNKEDLLAALWASYLMGGNQGGMLSTADSKPNVAVVEINGRIYAITVSYVEEAEKN